jgi:hypothetical protein
MSIINKALNAISPTGVDALKGTINKRNGLARPNRFAIFMTPPQQSLISLDLQGALSSALSGGFNPASMLNDPRDISMLCESCSMPGLELTTLDYQTISFPIKLPNGYNAPDVEFSFLLTGDYYIRKMFDNWLNLIVSREEYKVAYREEYATDVVIQQLNEKNVPVYGMRLQNAFPVSQSSIELNQTSSDSIQKLTVSFTYENMKPEGAITSVLAGVGSTIGGFTRII